MPERASGESLLAHLWRAVGASEEVVFLTDTSGVITFVNPQFTAVYGYTSDEVVGKVTPRLLKSGVQSLQYYEQVWHSLLNGQVVHMELVNRTKDGRLLTIEGSANPIIDDHGILMGFVAVQRDVTARRAFEEQHRLARFASDHAADAIFWVGQDGLIRYANEAATTMLGYAAAELCAMSVSDISPDFPPDQFAEHFGQNFPVGKITFESSLRKKDGTLLAAEVTVSYQTVDGQSTSCAIVRDLTDRRRLEDELRQAQKLETIGQLAGGIAHDFSNVLTVILGYSEFVIDQVRDTPGLRRDVEEIQKAGERALSLTRQLLIFSRKQAVAPQIIDLNQVVSDFSKMVRRMLGEHIRLDIRPEAQLGHIKVDPGQIEQVVMNLAVNARDAMPKGGPLTIATANVVVDAAGIRGDREALPGAYVTLSVTDTGSGIPPDVLPHVFEPFFTTKPHGKGTGLGLATVHSIVKQSGGYITIDSRLGAETTVTTYFPWVDAPVDSKASVARADQAADGIETILLVEDDVAVRALCRRTLQQRGYTVLEARDVADAIGIEANHLGPIDLLLSDIVMPDLNGPDLAQRLVRRRPTMQVLYISGYTHYRAIVVDSASPHTAFLQKPFMPDVLTLSVRELLDRGGRPRPEFPRQDTRPSPVRSRQL